MKIFFFFFKGKIFVEEECDDLCIFKIMRRGLNINTLTNGKQKNFKVLTYNVCS